jgi:glutamyl-Q tRNA(Asp) synthetase
VRIEDLDLPREVPGAAREILDTLAAFGMAADEPVEVQSRRGGHYEAAFSRLLGDQQVYGCACSRADIEQLLATSGAVSGVYPGTCRTGLDGRPARAWRFRVPTGRMAFEDRAAGRVQQDLEHDVGDFVVRRADGLWAYQLAVVVDDAAQCITDIVRGADLLDNTPRQIALQRALQLPTPRYMHVGVVTNERGEKLSKQTGAQALDRNNVLGELGRAAQHLGLPRVGAGSAAAFLRSATTAWAERWLSAPPVAGT